MMPRVALATAFVLLGTSISARQAAAPAPAPATPPPGQAAGQPQPQAIVPIAASSLAAHPAAYLGATVSMTGMVASPLGATAFTVVQGGSSAGGKEVLVLAPLLTAPVTPHSYVTVIGDAVAFDAAAVGAKMKNAMPVLPPGSADRFRGQPAIIATSVITTAMVDLAKRPPPPATPEEQALDGQMKQISPAFTALRQAGTTGTLPDVAIQAGALAKAFAATAPFWASHHAEDAAKLAADAATEAQAVADAAGKGDAAAAKAGIPKIQGACTTCHGAHRDRMDDGTYRWKDK